MWEIPKTYTHTHTPISTENSLPTNNHYNNSYGRQKKNRQEQFSHPARHKCILLVESVKMHSKKCADLVYKTTSIQLLGTLMGLSVSTPTLYIVCAALCCSISAWKLSATNHQSVTVGDMVWKLVALTICSICIYIWSIDSIYGWSVIFCGCSFFLFIILDIIFFTLVPCMKNNSRQSTTETYSQS